MNRARTLTAFTLAERLIVLVVAGVLAATGAAGLTNYRRTLALQSAAQQLHADLTYIRAQARRTSVSWTLTPARGTNRYTITSQGTAWTRDLPAPAVFPATRSMNHPVTYTAPYGLTAAPNRNLRVTTGPRTAQVNVVGSTGKIVVKDD